MRLRCGLSVLVIAIVNMAIAIVVAIHSHVPIGLVPLFVLTFIYIASRTMNPWEKPDIADEDDLSSDQCLSLLF